MLLNYLREIFCEKRLLTWQQDGRHRNNKMAAMTIGQGTECKHNTQDDQNHTRKTRIQRNSTWSYPGLTQDGVDTVWEKIDNRNNRAKSWTVKSLYLMKPYAPKCQHLSPILPQLWQSLHFGHSSATVATFPCYLHFFLFSMERTNFSSFNSNLFSSFRIS